MTPPVAREDRDEAAPIRLRSRPLIPGGEGAGADHPWDTITADDMASALDYVRADASPRIWITDGKGKPPKLWTHVEGVALRIDSVGRDSAGIRGWIEGWEGSVDARAMAAVLLGIVHSQIVRRVALRAAWQVQHFAAPHSRLLLDAVEPWNESGAPDSNAEVPAACAVVCSRIEELDRRYSGDGLLPVEYREHEALRAAYSTVTIYRLPDVFTFAANALATTDEPRNARRYTESFADKVRWLGAMHEYAIMLRGAVTLDMIVGAMIARKLRPG